jgi:hypothetical protein
MEDETTFELDHESFLRGLAERMMKPDFKIGPHDVDSLLSMAEEIRDEYNTAVKERLAREAAASN